MPNFVADQMMHFICGFVELRYKDTRTGNYITYHFNHTYFDGALMMKTIHNSIETATEISKIPYMRSYMFLNVPEQTFSKFVMACTRICEKLLLLQPKKNKITIAIIVSIRDDKDTNYGNKLKFTNITLYRHQRLLTKACKIKSAIKSIKTTTYTSDRPGVFDLFNLLKCDHVINSWDGLLSIVRADGTKLELCNVVNNNIFEQMIKEKCFLTIGSDDKGTFPFSCVTI